MGAACTTERILKVGVHKRAGLALPLRLFVDRNLGSDSIKYRDIYLDMLLLD
jgi:hypothetical protein